jgi:nicotinamidase-related amidase
MRLASTVLVVVDVQNGFITASSAPVVPTVVDLVRRWQDAGGAVIFTRYRNYAGSPFERLIGWRKLRTDQEVALVDELAPYAQHPNAHIVDKTVYTLFTDEGRKLLADHGFTDLLICGISTDGCVLKTAVDAFEADLTPWLVADACASSATRNDPRMVHDTAVMLAGRLVGEGQVIDSSRVIGWLPVPA